MRVAEHNQKQVLVVCSTYKPKLICDCLGGISIVFLTLEIPSETFDYIITYSV